MGIRVVHNLGDLAADLRTIARTTKPRMAKVVARNAREGNEQAKVYARESSGAHGKHYPRVFTVERTGVLEYEYGPDADIVVAGKKGSFNPGGMAPGFEWGSRNQRPHLDLARSADVIGRQMADDVSGELDDLFWPDG